MIAVYHVEFISGTAIVGAVAGCISVIFVVILYIYKKWWLTNVNGISCCNEICPLITSKPVPLTSMPTNNIQQELDEKLIKTLSFDVGDSSSESEISVPTEIQKKLSPDVTNDYFSQDLSLVEKGTCGNNHASYYHPIECSVEEFQKNVINIKKAAIVEQIAETKNFLDEKASKSTSVGVKNNDVCILEMQSIETGTEEGDMLSHMHSERINTSLIKNCGQLEIALQYDAPMRKMTVHILQASDIPSRDRGIPTSSQVRLILLPNKKQKHKTKIRSGDNPQFLESFLLHRINPEDVNSMGLRLRLYGCERMRRERLIGEAVVSFSTINLEFENNLWINLEPRSNLSLTGCSSAEIISLSRSNSIGSTHSVQHGGVPELLLGLCYNATTGHLSVEIIKGSHFRNLALNRAPDTYVKLHLVSSTGQRLGYSKTTVRRGQPNPLFKETFIFQVALFQLADVTLMVSVYQKKGVTKKKEMVGWFSLGLNSSGAEELAHWMDMKEYQQEQISRWHILLHT